MRIKLLDIPIDSLNREEVDFKLIDFLSNYRGKKIFTPNPEILVRSWFNTSFYDTLITGDLNIPDGIGIVWLAKIIGSNVPERITGTDLLLEICHLSSKLGQKTLFLGGKKGVAKEAATKMIYKFPGLEVVGAMEGGEVSLDKQGQIILDKGLLEKINKLSPDVVFVALGQEKQEKWIKSAMPFLPSVKLAMGVGGAFDFWSGRIRRAPKIIQRFGLEWLWRLSLQPRRFGRIITATVVFPLLVFGWHFGFIKRRKKK